MTGEQLRDYVKRLVDRAPELTEARKAELARLLAAGTARPGGGSR